jgi:hypothetical protein
MTLKTFVAHIRKIPAGFSVSYGRRWTAKNPTTIVVLPVGYADGVRRSLTNVGDVLIQGKRYPIVGTVTMDHIMIDVGNDPVKPGDEVVVWGEGPQGSIQILEVAEKIGTIPYELTCGVSKRVNVPHPYPVSILASIQGVSIFVSLGCLRRWSFQWLSSGGIPSPSAFHPSLRSEWLRSPPQLNQ